MSGLPPIPEIELTPAPLTQLAEGLSPAPWQYRFTGEDALEIASFNSQSGVRIAVHGRMWNEREGIRPFAFEHIPSTDRTRTLEVFGLPFGYLLNVVVFAISGTPRLGQTFISLHVIRGRAAARVLLATLLQGYVTAEQEVAFPGTPIQSSVIGGGYLRSLTGTDPAAGSLPTETVPTGARWLLRSVEVEFVTSATAGTRTVALASISTPGIMQFSTATSTQGPSDTKNYYWVPGLSIPPAAFAGRSAQSLPHPLTLLAGEQIHVTCQNMQAGDNFGAPHYQVEEWLEGA